MEKNIIKIAELTNKKVYPSNDPEGTGEPGLNFREALILQLAGNPKIIEFADYNHGRTYGIKAVINIADNIIEAMCEKKA